MPFNLEKFEAANLAPRTTDIELPALAVFFGKDEKPIFTVRGLNANELFKGMEASQKQKTMGALVEAMATQKEQVSAMRKALGLSDATPGEMAKRLEMLVAGCVAPVVSLPVAVKLAEHFPVEFMQLTNAITELTGKGSEMVKQKATTQKAKA